MVAGSMEQARSAQDRRRQIPGVLTRTDPATPPLPLVFDSPHSGSTYPEDFRPAVPLPVLRLTEDFQVDRLFGAAPDHGAVLIAAEFPRCYIDPNRGSADLDPQLLDGNWPGALAPGNKSRLGVGLVWRLVGPALPIYREPLPVAAVLTRLRGYYEPYHAEVQQALDALHGRFGTTYHVNCHSMSSVAGGQSPDAGRPRPDFTISDREGATCESEFINLVTELLLGMGYDARINDPYKGDELVRRHGAPAAGRHSLQIEINRRLYMDESRLAPNGNFNRLQQDVTRLIGAIADYVRGRIAG